MEVKSLIKSILKIKKRKIIECPTCKNHAKKPYIPFCSKKCSDIDLTKWLSEEHYNYKTNNYH